MNAATAEAVLERVAQLEDDATEAHSLGLIGDDARALVGAFADGTRKVVPLITGWGAARTGLLDAATSAIEALARHCRVAPQSGIRVGCLTIPDDTDPVLVGILSTLVDYVASVRQAVAEADTARLLGQQRAIAGAFGAGFSARSLGQGDPARESEPDEPESEPDGSWWHALFAVIGEALVALFRRFTVEIVIFVLAMVLAVAMIR